MQRDIVSGVVDSERARVARTARLGIPPIDRPPGLGGLRRGCPAYEPPCCNGDRSPDWDYFFAKPSDGNARVRWSEPLTSLFPSSKEIECRSRPSPGQKAIAQERHRRRAVPWLRPAPPFASADQGVKLAVVSSISRPARSRTVPWM